MTDVEKQIQDRLEQEADADFEGAQDLIDAHIDEVAGGFSLHVQFSKPNLA